MGCTGSKKLGEQQDVYNKEYDAKRRFMMGVHLGKAPNGIEGNVQIGCVSNGFWKYFRVGTKGVKKVNEEESNNAQIKDDATEIS